MYAQVIDDVAGNTIVSASTLQSEVKEGLGVKIGPKVYTKTEVEKNLYHHFEEKQ